MKNKKLILKNMVKVFLIIYLFYKNIVFSVLISPLGYFLYKREKIKIKEEKLKEIEEYFKEFLISLNNFLRAGKSIENAIKFSLKELEGIYTTENIFTKELTILVNKVDCSIPIEHAFESFLKEKNIKSIKKFSKLLKISKRSGGNINEIIEKNLNIILMKIKIEDEIDKKIAAKKFECEIVKMMPYFLIIILNLIASDYISPLYNNLFGNLIMSIALVLIIFSNKLIEEISKVEV